MKPLKLLNLPFNAMEKVFRLMNKMDLIETSLTSKKAGNFIKLLRMFADSYIVKYTKDLMTIQLILEDGHQLVWNFDKNVRFPKGIREIQGIRYLCRRRLETMYCKIDEFDGDLMIRILEHLMSIFPGFVSDLQLQVCSSNKFIEHITEQVGFCDSLLLSGEKNLEIIKYIMDNMKIGRKLEITQPLDGFHHPKILEVPELISHQSSWITPKTLLNLKSSYAVLRQSSLTKEHMIEFLHAFCRRDIPRHAMGWWKIDLKGSCTTADIESAILHSKYDKNVRDARFSRISDGKLEEYDARWGTELVRDDGLIATITVGVCGLLSTMNIMVWHDTRPNAKHRKQYEGTLKKTIDKYCQRNHAVARNLRKMHEMTQKIAELKLENEKLKEENVGLRAEKSDLDEAREQFERVNGIYANNHENSSSEKYIPVKTI